MLINVIFVHYNAARPETFRSVLLNTIYKARHATHSLDSRAHGTGRYPAGLALAQDTTEQDTMVVVGSRTPTEISQIPGAVWVIGQQELQDQIRAGADLKTALGKLVPGLDLAPQGRTNYGQNMRGRTAQVLIDGVSLNSSRGISRQFDSIDPFNIERVEVLSGASSLYGGGQPVA